MSLVSNWWGYLDQFAAAVESDFNFYAKKSLIEGDISSFTMLTNDSNMAISRTATIHEYVSIDASNGPVIIMDNVTIKPFSALKDLATLAQTQPFKRKLILPGHTLESIVRLVVRLSNQLYNLILIKVTMGI